MKDTFRKSMKWLHTWASLIFGWILFFIFLTGSIGYFEKEIDMWMRPEIPILNKKITNEELASIAVNYLKTQASNSNRWYIHLPNNRESKLLVEWDTTTNTMQTSFSRPREGLISKQSIINPDTNRSIQVRETGGGYALYRMHFILHYLDKKTIGRNIVGIAAIIMLIALISGIVIHINIFKDLFTFRRDKNLYSWLDVHVITGVFALPFHLMITYSGLVLFIFAYVPFIPVYNYDGKIMDYVNIAFPSEKPIKISNNKQDTYPISIIVNKAKRQFNANVKLITIINYGDASCTVKLTRDDTTLLDNNKFDRLYFSGITGNLISDTTAQEPKATEIRSILAGLHRGRFSDTVLRWLYFLSGILGTIMIASGLIIWTKKREYIQQNTLGFKLVNGLNIGTIIGLPIAIASYFIANRLIPIDTLNRVNMEIDTMFLTWGFIFIIAFILKNKKAWYILSCIASFLYFLIPLINFFSSNRHLIISISNGDWVFVWIDLIFITIGFIFAIMSYKLYNKLS